MGTQTGINRRNFLRLSATGASALLAASVMGHGHVAQANEANDASASSYQPGTYEASADGKNGPVTVRVTFSDSAIDSVEITSHFETIFISDVALERVPADIVANQSLDVDIPTGATLTGYAVLSAVEDCVDQAGGDSAALRKVAVPEKTPETVELDTEIVIVGAGGAGLTAAIAAAQRGAKDVVVLEVSSSVGGNTLVSGGALSYPNAPEDLRHDMSDSYRAYFEQVMDDCESKGVDQALIDSIRADYDAYYAGGSTKVFDSIDFNALETAWIYSNLSPENIAWEQECSQALVDVDDWLNDQGFPWTPLIGILGFNWPRRTFHQGSKVGEGFFQFYNEVIEKDKLPITIIVETKATELIYGDDGTVTGVAGESVDGTTYRVSASRGVLLAAGGCSGNSDMIKQYDEFWNFDADRIIPTDNTYGHNGDGITLGIDAGGYAKDMGRPMMLPAVDCQTYVLSTWVGPLSGFLGVNREGKRFVNEDADRYTLTKAFMEQTDERMYIISDINNCQTVDGITVFGMDEQVLLDRGQLFKADTLEELAKKAGLDATGLVETVKRFNEMCETGKDPDFGRTVFTEECPVTTGPFFASPRTWASHITIGGLVIDADCHVVREDGSIIPGLFATGETAANVSGLADCFAFGKRAADVIMEA